MKFEFLQQKYFDEIDGDGEAVGEGVLASFPSTYVGLSLALKPKSPRLWSV